MQNQQKMLKQIQQMQDRMSKIQEELDAAEVTGTAGGGAVTVTANGQQRLLAVTIEGEAMEEGAEMLADLVLAAANQALDRSREMAASRMSEMTAGMGLPPGLI